MSGPSSSSERCSISANLPSPQKLDGATPVPNKPDRPPRWKPAPCSGVLLVAMKPAQPMRLRLAAVIALVVAAATTACVFALWARPACTPGFARTSCPRSCRVYAGYTPGISGCQMTNLLAEFLPASGDLFYLHARRPLDVFIFGDSIDVSARLWLRLNFHALRSLMSIISTSHGQMQI